MTSWWRGECNQARFFLLSSDYCLLDLFVIIAKVDIVLMKPVAFFLLVILNLSLPMHIHAYILNSIDAVDEEQHMVYFSGNSPTALNERHAYVASYQPTATTR